MQSICDTPFTSFHPKVQKAVLSLSKDIRRMIDISEILRVAERVADEFSDLHFAVILNESGGFVTMTTSHPRAIGDITPVLRRLAKSGLTQDFARTDKQELSRFWSLTQKDSGGKTDLYMDAYFSPNAKCERVQVGEKTVPVYKWDCEDKELERELGAV